MRHDRRFFVPALVALTMVAATGVLRVPAAGAAGPTTYRDFVYPTSVTASPTADKPQSKLWYQDGAWWGLLVASANNGVHIFELRADHTWRDTVSIVDNRTTATGDALWDGSRLYVASRTASGALRLNRLVYDRARRAYTPDAGFPVTIASGGSESVTIAKDTTGLLWATFTQQSKVWVTHSRPGNDASWVAPFLPPTGDTSVAADDISAIAAFDGIVGVMWSNQVSNAMRFATHRDGDADTVWGPLETALAGPRLADDHLNLKNMLTDSAGRLYAAIKTSQGDCSCDPPSAPLVMLLVRSRTGSWTNTTFGTVADKHTRPLVMLDETNRSVYMFATAPESGGTIYYKQTSMDAPSFAPGRGAPFVTWPGATINNATGAKQAVNAATGLVVLASDTATRTYYHAELPLAAADTTAPSAPANLTATAASSTRVDLSWSAATDNTGVTGYTVYRDGTPIGTTTATVFADGGVAPSSTHTYTVDAFDAGGNHSAMSDSATATTPPAPAGSITFVSASYAANPTATTLVIAAPAGVSTGDVLVAAVSVRGNPAITAPAGWNLVRRDQATTTMGQAVYVRVVVASEPASYTWTLSSSQAAAGGIVAYRGVDTTAPVDTAGGQVNASSTQIGAPSVTASSAGEVLVGFFGIASNTTVSPPAGMTEQGERASSAGTYKVTAEGATSALASAGATGGRTATAANAAASIGQLVVLRPA